MNIHRYIWATVLVCTVVSVRDVRAQDSYARIAELRSANGRIAGLRPTADGEHYTLRTTGGIVRKGYADKGAGELLQRIPFAFADYTLSPDERSILVASSENMRRIYRRSYSADYWLAPLGGELRKVLEGVRDVSFSPDGRMLAFSKDNNLMLYDIAGGKTTAVTDDGKWNAVINGTSDWVYEEEYAFTKGYAFSPDGGKIAYLRFDESEVPTASILRYGSRDDAFAAERVESFKYPRAGERNSTVELWLYDIVAGTKSRVDVGAETDQYILNPSWTPAGDLYFYRINRRQNRFEVVLQRPDGSQKVIYDEQSPQYVERPDASTVTFIDGDRFIVREETTTGYMHLYLHSVERGRLRALTEGEWEVTEIVAADSRNVYYVSTETSPLRRNLWRTGLDGKGRKRLTTGEGYYTIAPSTGMKYYIATFSNAETPNIVTVHRADGRTVDTLLDSRSRVAALGRRAHREFFTFATERGDTLDAFILKPLDFDPSKRYPVLITQYSGPGSQQVADRWNVDWEDALVEHGYIVVCADGRGTGYRGERFKKATYGQLGALETEDQLSLARHIAAQPYADPDRIGIYGWSYGGFMALNCALKGDGLFKTAIAVAPVTSWRFYDTIYTEIYNGLPQDNPSGYDDNSPVNFADRLADRTRLLIMHGTADDNVHLKNTMEMIRALERAGRRFDVMLYPDQNHSMMPDNTADIRRRMIDFALENL